MSTGAISSVSQPLYAFSPQEATPTQQTSAARSDNRWKNAFIPKTSKSWEVKPICVDEFDKNPNCCASAYDIEAIVEGAYEDGLEGHSGVKAIEGHPRPCVTTADLETLMDELAPMANKAPARPEISGVPKGLNIKGHPGDVYYDYESNKFCINLVKSVLKYSYGILKDIPQKKQLGENFEKVRNYCAEAVEYRFGLINVIRNNLPIRKPW